MYFIILTHTPQLHIFLFFSALEKPTIDTPLNSKKNAELIFFYLETHKKTISHPLISNSYFVEESH